MTAVAAAPRSIYELPKVIPPNERPIIGRQPALVQIAPSKRYPWLGHITGDARVVGLAIQGGDRFTAQQAQALADRSIDADAVEVIFVRRDSTDAEIWTPLNRHRSVFGFDCPIIGHRGDQVRIIAPDGQGKLVRADGWGHKPRWRHVQEVY